MTTAPVKTLTVHELYQHRQTTPSLCLIDVREPYEWDMFRIPGALLIPKGEIEVQIENKIPDLATPIYLYCAGGVRSLYAAERLVVLGYQTVYSIDGGIQGWHASGYPIES